MNSELKSKTSEERMEGLTREREVGEHERIIDSSRIGRNDIKHTSKKKYKTHAKKKKKKYSEKYLKR